VKRVAIEAVQCAELSVADADGSLQHGCKHRLKIAGRAADDLKHLRRGRLLLQRLGEFARALLLGIKQAHVLDGNGGLISERRQKSNVLLLERSHLGASDQNGTKRAPFADQRHGDGGTMSEPDRKFPPEGELVAGILHVCDLDRLQIADGTAGHR